ncbi:hypothetical protein GSI_06416 [Ganoderma sinense ZZ0214-1]|uniref:Uncharacterized protein n=1 Tax=Ganoderma sinense ZZ0214-1 TaxID=1077348 RepID=A0A2G8SD83_9APHY|nr:hypothetical protein GSI_06416 [Ganoderma sinense ZZ0214-1]
MGSCPFLIGGGHRGWIYSCTVICKKVIGNWHGVLLRLLARTHHPSPRRIRDDDRPSRNHPIDCDLAPDGLQPGISSELDDRAPSRELTDGAAVLHHSPSGSPDGRKESDGGSRELGTLDEVPNYQCESSNRGGRG